MNLFFIVLGGKIKGSHIEQHDVRWVVGKDIEETFPQLCNEWIGIADGLHIDSYMTVKFVDGFQVNVKAIVNQKEVEKSQLKTGETSPINKLWFVNLGGYYPNQLIEQHQYILTVATSSFEARNRAIKKSAFNVEKKHTDNLKSINKIININNNSPVKGSSGWSIELIPDPLKRNQSIKPDWYGYRRIDK